MPYQPRDSQPQDFREDDSLWAGPVEAGRFVGEASPRDGRYGVAVRDMFSDAAWTPAEPVRARGWRDSGTGAVVQSSATTFD